MEKIKTPEHPSLFCVIIISTPRHNKKNSRLHTNGEGHEHEHNHEYGHPRPRIDHLYPPLTSHYPRNETAPKSNNLPRQQRLFSQVHEICNKTGHPLLCTNSVMHRYKTSSFTTAARVEQVTVLYTAVEATSEYVTRAVLEARSLRNDTSFVAAQLEVCEEVYGNVVAVDGILTKNLFALFTSLQNVGMAAKACEEAVKTTSSEKVAAVMTEFDERVTQMGVVCLDLAHMLYWPIHDWWEPVTVLGRRRSCTVAYGVFIFVLLFWFLNIFACNARIFYFFILGWTIQMVHLMIYHIIRWNYNWTILIIPQCKDFKMDPFHVLMRFMD